MSQENVEVVRSIIATVVPQPPGGYKAPEPLRPANTASPDDRTR
jgi:hypothetical protein